MQHGCSSNYALICGIRALPNHDIFPPKTERIFLEKVTVTPYPQPWLYDAALSQAWNRLFFVDPNGFLGRR